MQVIMFTKSNGVEQATDFHGMNSFSFEELKAGVVAFVDGIRVMVVAEANFESVEAYLLPGHEALLPGITYFEGGEA